MVTNNLIIPFKTFVFNRIRNYDALENNNSIANQENKETLLDVLLVI